MERKSFEEGIILALVSPPIPHVVKREPIAYSYNGVILPALPEWDREKYPYAFISHNFIMQPSLYVASEVTHDYTESGTWTVSGKCIAVYSETIYVDSGVWVESDGGEHSNPLSRIDWANFDVLNKDGSIYLSASEPIPVYE